MDKLKIKKFLFLFYFLNFQAKAMAKPIDILSVAINDGVNAESSLYRLKRGQILRIIPGVSLLGRHVALYCNYPVTGQYNLYNYKKKIA